ncbi:hypothetical protein MBLNU457_4864t1 [Dothideomycetes sp. NU457]
MENYHKLSSWSAYHAKIADITLDKLTFSCEGKTYVTPFDPPMTSYREARERVVEMDKECVSALGRSDITISRYAFPTGWYLGLFTLVATVFVVFSTRRNFASGGLIASVVPDFFRRFCSAIQPYLFWGMVAIHGTETYVFVTSRLIKHNVNVMNPVFWNWAGDCFISGVGAFQRFDAMVNQKRIEKERQKH